MMPDLVSIIMPMYNAGRFVRQAVQSVLDQTHSNWELLIIDDGSTDDSFCQVRQFQDKRILMFSQENRGVSAARNVALADMKGAYFCFLDADDVLPPRSLEVRLRMFNGAISFVDGGIESFDLSMKTKMAEWRPRAQGNVLKKLFRVDNSCFFGLTSMIKRNARIDYRFDETLTHCEDLLFFMTIAHSGNYAYTDEVILRYRKNNGSAMQNINGLAGGYTALRNKMCTLFKGKLSLWDKLVYDVKVRKIMFLTFSRDKRYRTALRYFVYGRL
jgi:teichuronic acid biosynthesis glycosyltransferase TuaG